MKSFKKLCLVGTICLTMLASTSTVLAATPSSVQSKYGALKDEDKTKITVAGDRSSVSVNGSNVSASASGGNGLAPVTIGNTTVYMSQENIDALDGALSKFSTNAEKERTDKGAKGAKAKLSSLEKGFDVNADIDNAALALSGFKGIISTIVGLLAYAVVILFGLFTSIDIAYITVSPLRNFLDDKGEWQTGKTSDGSPKIRVISDEAIYSVRNSTIENGKNPLGSYVIKRSFGVIMLGIAIYILLTGNFGLLMQLSLNLVSGIIDMIAKLAGAA